MIKTINQYKQMKLYLLPLIILVIIFLMIISPSIAISSFTKGITLWATKVLPTLLPFFILTKILSYTSIVDQIGKYLSPITRKLYGVGGIAGYIYIMSIISGYPVGAKLTSDYYKSGKLSQGQAYTITSFTSTSGPLFILGTIGIGMYHSTHLGIIILISHYVGALINGLLFRNKHKYVINDSELIVNDNKLSITDIMSSSINSILLIGGFIALAFMITELLINYRCFIAIEWVLGNVGIDTNITNATLSGIIEITTGSMMLTSTTLSFKPLATILTFLVSFGGLSIHTQAYIFLSSFNMPYSKFLLQKICHAIISSAIALLICLL